MVANTGRTDPRLLALRRLLADNADPVHAEFHRGYHKSQLRFYGLKTPLMHKLLREVFPARQKLEREQILPVATALWQSEYWEERMLAIDLLMRIEPQLGPGDLPLLKGICDGCEGWAQLDSLACGPLSCMALRLGEPIYRAVAGWRDDDCMWTRRASILVHIIPARRAELARDWCWDTWESRLHEKEFFIRKAIGWALREASKHYPGEVHAFLKRAGDKASGLTRREGARNLPEELRVDILGK